MTIYLPRRTRTQRFARAIRQQFRWWRFLWRVR